MAKAELILGELSGGGGELLLAYSYKTDQTFPTLTMTQNGTLYVRAIEEGANYVNNSEVNKNGTAISWTSKVQSGDYNWIMDYEVSVSSGDVITFTRGGNGQYLILIASLNAEIPTPT